MFKIEVIPTGMIPDAMIVGRCVFLSHTGAFVRKQYADVFTVEQWEELQAHMRGEGKYDDRIAGVKMHAA